jgi:hypothetical protein
MALYVITKLRSDEDGWLQEAIWREADGATNKYISNEQRVLAADIDQALERGDAVNVVAKSHAGSITANEVMERVMRDGRPAFRIHPQSDTALFRVERY